MAWLAEQRILEAQRLLEATDLLVEDVASRCGFGSAVTLRSHLVRRCGTTPSAYRRRYRT
jgi:transcriptional regulator GlxA family with amidase domain